MTEDDVLTLARTVWGEARGESVAGQKAVICTVLNRFNSGRWYAGKTIAETCRKPWQYSCWNKKDPNRAKMEALTYIELKTVYRADTIGRTRGGYYLWRNSLLQP